MERNTSPQVVCRTCSNTFSIRLNILDTPVSLSSQQLSSLLFKEVQSKFDSSFCFFFFLHSSRNCLAHIPANRHPLCKLTVINRVYVYTRSSIAYVYIYVYTYMYTDSVACCVVAATCARLCAHACVYKHVQERRSCKWSSRLATYSLSRDSCTLSADAFESSCQL